MSQTDNKFQSLETKIRTVLETRNTGTEARVKLPNVGRQDSDKPTSNNSVLAKTSSIKTKIVDEGESSMLKDNKNFNLSTDLIDATRQIIEKKDTEDKAKKTDAGDMTGGKTKIELEPKTDDSTQDENLETTKSKKIRQTLNKEIGQAGAAGVKEEVEQVDELSRATLGSYINKASHDVAAKSTTAGGYDEKSRQHRADVKIPASNAKKGDATGDARRELDNLLHRHHARAAEKVAAGVSQQSLKRQKGIAMAVNKLTKEEVEQVDELSKATLGSYIKKANYAGGMADFKHGRIADRRGDSKEKTALAATSHKRTKGIAMAVNKLTKEEVEQVDELSKATLGSYIKKASHDVATKSAATGRYGEKSIKHSDDAKKFDRRQTGDSDNWSSAYFGARSAGKVADRFFNQSWKRREGIAKAVDKLTKEGVENELNDDELDILDLIAFELEDLDKVELDEARGRPSLPRDKSGKIIRDPAAIAAHRTSQSTSNDESPHIVDQLRKVITTNGKQHVTFKSGETHPISVNHAKAALIKHRDAGKPVDKAKVAGHMWASHDSFKSALAGEKAPESAIKRASGRGSVSLPPLKSSTKSHEPAMTPDTIKRSAAAFAAYRKEKNK